ncbi:IQ domain-containing protein M isoform X2 [Fukomys damarensis]|uniref:IQ domain-containing protein M isoform X2 n=1 Tax=Fukomys damarensis TaxID=885580 RepID=UPI00053F8D07|nr:IQ domain-containing protein M isoform X2 [Fukomys damarensis]
MATAEVLPEKAKCPTLEITRQDFLQEAKSLIAQHYEKINENKVQVHSINVFRNKHQKPKSIKYVPLEIKKKETADADVIQEHRAALRRIAKECSKIRPSEEPSRGQISSKEPHCFNIKEKVCSADLITREQVKLGKIMTDIESVSKKMEKEKQQHAGKSRMLESLYTLPAHCELTFLPITSSMGLQKEPDKPFYDWRGSVSTKAFHSPPVSSWSFSGSSGMFQDYSMKTLKKKEQQKIKPESKPETRRKDSLTNGDKLGSKVKRIGPHIEIFQVFQERNRFIITKKVVRLITIMQARVRGWLERKRLQRITAKALYHGPNLKAVIDMYRGLIHHVKYQLGLWRTRQIINLAELEEWMDRKKFYETMFAKREHWQGLERSELLKYFNDCGHFPTQKQIDDYWDMACRERQKYYEVIKKSQAIEMIFTLYPPRGANVANNTRIKSTWLRPIVNGEEGYKYIGSQLGMIRRVSFSLRI